MGDLAPLAIAEKAASDKAASDKAASDKAVSDKAANSYKEMFDEDRTGLFLYVKLINIIIFFFWNFLGWSNNLVL